MGKRTTDGAENIAVEAARIKDTDHWPNWPILPMKNLQRSPSDRDRLGFMVANDFTVVYLGPVYQLKAGPLLDQLTAFDTERYNTTEELVDSGWVGD